LSKEHILQAMSFGQQDSFILRVWGCIICSVLTRIFGGDENIDKWIKSCNDFMKRGFAAQFGERLKFLSPQQATGYLGIFTTAHRAVTPHFLFKKDLILYLNSSRAASSGEFKFKDLENHFNIIVCKK